MDKIRLDKEQLKVLVDFIKSRSFKEPFVIVEILDHFACKVEELLNDDPKIITLNEAMVAAHRSFGVAGFQPLAAAYYAALQKRYNNIFWKEVKKVITSVIYLPLLALLSIGFYKSCFWINKNVHSSIFDLSYMSLAGFMIITLASAVYRIKHLKIDKVISNTVYRPVTGLIYYGTLLGSFLSGSSHINDISVHKLNMSACVFAVLLLLFTIREICLNKTLQIAQKEMQGSYDYYTTLVG